MTAYFFDTETTSRDDDREIVEVGMLRLGPGADLLGQDYDLISLEITGVRVRRFKPSQPITFGSIAVHHILPSEVEHCEPAAMFRLPDDCTYLIGHSIDFDWNAIGAPEYVKRICTFAIVQHLWPDKLGHSLVAMTYRLNGTTEATRDLVRDAHSAEHDCRLDYLLLKAILEQRPEIKHWSELWAFSEECRIPLTCPMKRYEGVPLAELDDGFIRWCLNQDWLDPYFRVGLERVMAQRYPRFAPTDEDDGVPY